MRVFSMFMVREATMKRNLIGAFRPHNSGLEKLFGSLEAEIMDILWGRQRGTARDVFEALRDRGQRLSYGAVKTVMDRLVVKDMLDRMSYDGQYHYTPLSNREEFTQSAVREIIGGLFDSFGEPAVSLFMDRIKAEPERLAQLSALISEAERKHTGG